MARAVGAGQPEFVALNTLGTVTCTLVDVDAGLRLLEEALRLAVAHGDAQEQMRSHWNLYSTTMSATRWGTPWPGSTRRPPRCGGSARGTWCPASRSAPPTSCTGWAAGTRPRSWWRTPAASSRPGRTRFGSANWT
jgi:hypothetical protein